MSETDNLLKLICKFANNNIGNPPKVIILSPRTYQILLQEERRIGDRFLIYNIGNRIIFQGIRVFRTLDLLDSDYEFA